MDKGSNKHFVDDATFTSWLEEGSRQMPDVNTWAALVARLRDAAAMDAQSLKQPESGTLPLEAIDEALQAVVQFLQQQPYFDRHGEAVAPLVKLSIAFNGLRSGRSNAMFEPIREPGSTGAPPSDQMKEMIKGFAARAVSELYASGETLPHACKLVADALQTAARRDRNTNEVAGKKGFGKVTAAKVRNWRARIMEGPGPGATDMAIEHYRHPLPDGMGATAAERGKSLLRVLRERAANLV